jgi:hypothetical protein
MAYGTAKNSKSIAFSTVFTISVKTFSFAKQLLLHIQDIVCR